MKIKLLLILSMVTLWNIAIAQTYTYTYSVLKNGTIQTENPKDKNVWVQMAKDKRSCKVGNEVYNYKGGYDGYYVYEYMEDIGDMAGFYSHTAKWLIFSSSYDELSRGESCYARNAMGEADISEGLGGMMQQMGYTGLAAQIANGYSTAARKILDVYKINPINELRSRYESVTPDNTNKIYYVKKGQYYGVCNAVGEEVLAPNKYTSITSDGYGFLVTANGKTGYLNSSFREVISPEYSYITRDGASGFYVEKGGKKGYCDSYGRVVIQPKYTKITSDGSSGYYVEDGYLKGYCDSNGNVVFPLRNCTRLVKSYPGYFVYVGGNVGYYNSNGTEVIAPNKYTDIERKAEGFVVKNGRLVGFCTPEGKEVVSPQYSEVERDGNDGYVVKDSYGKVGYVNRHGQTVVRPIYSSVIKSGSSGFYVRSGNTEGFLDASGSPVVPIGKYSSVSRSSDGGFTVKSGNKVGYVNASGKEIIPPKYNSVKKVGDRFQVMLNGQEGWCNSRGREILPPWKYLYFEMTYGLGLNNMNHFVGAQFTSVRRVVGYNVALTGGLTSGSVTLMGGPTFRLNRNSKSLQLYGQVGGTYGFRYNGGLSLAAGAGMRYGFNKGSKSKLDWFSMTLGAQYIEREIVPTIGICVVPAGDWLYRIVADDNDFPTHFSEITVGYGDDLYMGVNYTFLKNRLGLYASFAYGFFEGAPCFNVGPAIRLTDCDRSNLDLQLYQGFGSFDGDFGGETGLRFGFSRDRKFGASSLSLGAIYSSDHFGVMMGISWPILFFPFAIFF